MLAGHRLVNHLWIIDPVLEVLFVVTCSLRTTGAVRMRRVRYVTSAGVIPVDPQPVHLAAFGNLILANDRDVVLALAGYHTGVAAHARTEIDGHAPLVHIASQLGLVLIRMLVNFALIDGVRLDAHVLGEHGLFIFRTFKRFLIRQRLEVWLQSLVGHGGLANNRAAFHAPVFLRARQGVIFVAALDVGTGGKIGRGAGTNGVGIEAAHFRPAAFVLEIRNAQLTAAAIAERQGQGVVCLPRLHPNGAFNRFAAERHSGELAVFKVELLSRLAAHADDVIPYDFCDGIRHFLTPTVVGKAAVVHAEIAREDDFQIVLGRGLALECHRVTGNGW